MNEPVAVPPSSPEGSPSSACQSSAKRSLDASKLPLWRKAEIIAGVIRAKLKGIGKVGTHPILHPRTKLRRTHGQIRVGSLSELHEGVVLTVAGSQSSQAQLTIGRRTSIWYGTVISAKRSVSIGDECAISWNCTILDSDMHELLPSDPAKQVQPVIIEDHVWLGANVTVLKGVTIGHDSMVAAGSVVRHDIPPFSLAAGNPAMVIRKIDGWK